MIFVKCCTSIKLTTTASKWVRIVGSNHSPFKTVLLNPNTHILDCEVICVNHLSPFCGAN